MSHFVRGGGCKIALPRDGILIWLSQDGSLRVRHHARVFHRTEQCHGNSNVVALQSPDLVLPRRFPPALTTTAFARSRQWWFGTCSCKPVPRGPPSSIKQLHTSRPFR